MVDKKNHVLISHNHVLINMVCRRYYGYVPTRPVCPKLGLSPFHELKFNVDLANFPKLLAIYHSGDTKKDTFGDSH